MNWNRSDVEDIFAEVPSGLTEAERERLAAVKARPRDPASHGPHEHEILPRHLEDFSLTQKALHAEVVGDAEAERIFGFGPWLRTERTKKAVAQRRARREQKE